MTVDDVRLVTIWKVVDKIRHLTDDDEAAHSSEDDLHTSVLHEIAREFQMQRSLL